MSTRSQVIIKDRYNELWFYRHSDGYPGGVMPTLLKFIKWVREGKIRSDVEQGSGWLVMIGAEEYFEQDKELFKSYPEHKYKEKMSIPSNDKMCGWKVGAYEPSIPERHGDIEYIYLIDLAEKSIKGYKVGNEQEPVVISEPDKLQMVNDDGVLEDIKESDLR